LQSAPPKRPLRQALKRAGIAVLFLSVLIIPALRRLRRRLWIWTGVRALAVAGGGWLISRFIYASAGAGVLMAGIMLATLGLILKSSPSIVSLDSTARTLGALVVVNGGSLLSTGSRKRVPQVHLFVLADRIIAMSKSSDPLFEIPFSSMRDLSAHASSGGTRHKRSVWNLDLTWQSSELSTTQFSYEGVFAEHLARVAETTLLSLWKKELPVLRV
jgi:hypothetical protein